MCAYAVAMSSTPSLRHVPAAAAPEAPVALITGATSGIGLAIAHELAADGYRLILVARDLERLDATAVRLMHRYRIVCEVLSCDLSRTDGDGTIGGIRQVTDLIDSRRVDVVVNNAGYGLRTSLLRTDPAELAKLDTVLIRAVEDISWHAAHAMRARGRGGIVNIASMAAVTTMGTYAGAKSHVLIFTESLAAELAGTGVTATAVLPGFVRTEFHDRMDVDMSHLPAAAWVDVSTVARQGLRDARAGKVVSVPGVQYKLAYAAAQVLPRPLIRFASNGFRFTRQSRR